MAVIVWLLDLQLPMQSVPITTNVALRKILRLPYKIYIYKAKHLFCLV